MSFKPRDITDSVFDEVFDRTAPALFAAACRVLGDNHFAEDVVQEAYTQLYRTMQAGRLVHSPDAWLRRTVINAALNRREKEGIRTWLPLWQHLVDGQVPSPEEQVSASDECERIDSAVADLPEQQRQAFIMRTTLEMSYREIGEALGCRSDTAQEYFRSARLKLFRVLRTHLNQE